jgi:hypothetical protein
VTVWAKTTEVGPGVTARAWVDVVDGQDEFTVYRSTIETLLGEAGYVPDNGGPRSTGSSPERPGSPAGRGPS